MYIATVPLVEDTTTFPGAVLRRPDLPAAILRKHRGWGQASNCLHGRNKTILWLNLTTEEADVLANHPGCVVRGRPHPLKETSDLESGMQRGSRRAMKDFTAAYRTLTTALEEAEARRAWLEKNVPAVLKLGGQVLLMWLLAQANPALALMSYTVVSSDTWTGTTWESVAGTTMDAARGGSAHTWGGDLYFFRQGSNRIYRDGAGNLYDATLGVTSANVKATMRVGPSTTRSMGPGVRIQVTDNKKCYMAGLDTVNSTLELWRYDSIYGGAQLGSDGGTAVEDDEITVRAEGSTISGLRNGVLECGPATDTTYASGYVGISWWGVGSRGWWEAQTEPVASGAPVIRRRATMKALLGR